MTANYIVSASLDIYGGLLKGTIEFTPGLNIISGENGTLKTKVLQSLRGGSSKLLDPARPIRIQSISPKRNSERRAADAIVQFFRQQNRTWDNVLNERLGTQINETGFDNYPSLADLYYLIFEHRCRDGADRREHMARVTEEFNAVIRTIFEHYVLVADWNAQTGAPTIRIQKHGVVQFPIESLSMGEQEILSLIASIDAGKGTTDVYLIDEPEVHLNWHLEEKLFQFLDSHCTTNDKQAIVVTHSRTIFRPQFLPKVQFFHWEDGRILWGRTLTREQKKRLAGDAVEIIGLGSFAKTTFFVEDAFHFEALMALAGALGADISVTQCGTSSNVRSLFKYSRTAGGWANTYFLNDGDNEGNPFPGSTQFIHLAAYSFENLFLHPETLSVISGKPLDEVRQIILDAIWHKRGEIFRKNRFFEFLIDELTTAHITFDRLLRFDGSLILPEVSGKLGFIPNDFPARYIAGAISSGSLEELMPVDLVAAIKSVPLASGDEPTA